MEFVVSLSIFHPRVKNRTKTACVLCTKHWAGPWGDLEISHTKLLLSRSLQSEEDTTKSDVGQMMTQRC